MNNTVGMELQMEVTNITLHAINEQDKQEISYYTRTGYEIHDGSRRNWKLWK